MNSSSFEQTHFNKLESPTIMDSFLNCVDVFLLFRNYLPLEKGEDPSFVQTWIPFTYGCFLQSLVEIGPVVLEKKMKMWRVYDNNDNGDNGQIVIRKANLSLRLRWAKTEIPWNHFYLYGQYLRIVKICKIILM